MTWTTPTVGTVTSVAATVPSGLAVSGSPITTTGTLALTWSGTIPASSLPAPSATTLGGTQSATAAANNFMTGISTAGVPTFAQPAFSNLSGSVAAAQMPALTGDVTTTAGTVATTISAGVVTLGKMATLAANSVVGNNTGVAATPIALTQAQLTALCNTFTSALSGDVPAPGASNTSGFYLSGAGTWVSIPAGSTGANPTGTVGLTAVNGSATTFMRSDAAPPLSQAIAPTWTGAHKFTAANPQLTLGAAGGNAGGIALNGSTSGQSSIYTGPAGALALQQTANTSINFYDGASNGIIWQSIGNTTAAANYVQSSSAPAASAPWLAAVGTDTNINLSLVPKGTGSVAVTGPLTATKAITTGTSGGTAGSLTLNGSTSGSATIAATATGGITATPVASTGFNVADGANGNALIVNGAGGSAIANQVTIAANTTNNAPTINPTGTDTNISLTLGSKGTGGVYLKGVSDGSAGVAGYVGEYISATGSGVALTSGTSATIASITLTAGDWDITGLITFSFTGTYAVGTSSAYVICLSTVTNSPTAIDGMAQNNIGYNPQATAGLPVGAVRINSGPSRVTITATTTYYLVGNAQFSTGPTFTGGGMIRARRVR